MERVILLAVLFLLTSGAHAGTKLSAKPKWGHLQVGGLQRDYIYYIPAKAPVKPLPLILVLHGGTGKPEGMEKLTFNRFNELADQDPAIIVYPAGIDHNWNDGREDVSSTAFKENIDDVGFISKLIDEMVQIENADPHRVYVTGISNGAIMANRLACELSDKIAAIAPVSGSMPVNLPAVCSPKYPVSVLMINGDKDPLVPFEGGTVHFFNRKRGQIISAPQTAAHWAQMDRCLGNPVTVALPVKDPQDPTRVDRITYPSAKNGAEVFLFVIHGGGHTWPDGLRYLGEWAVGKVSHQLAATDLIWDFFKRHSR
jgi:polyhydroxybutyrate depolymerase